MSTRMQQRRGTAAQWLSTNTGNGPILAAGEIGFESDTNKFKIGDGVNHWVDLTYFTDAESITAALNNIIDGAPAALNTLNELAAALGDDANFLANLATESYVDTAIGNIDALPSQATNNGKFLTTNGSAASWATVDLTSKQDVVSGVSSTEIGYLDGVTSAIQTQLNAKLESSDLTGLATETYVDTAISGAEVDQSALAGAGIDWTGTQFAVDTATVFANPTISTGLTLDGTGDFTISADANIILDATTEVYIGSAATGNEVATKSYADTAASNAAAAIVDSAPGALNTLNELAAAINDDASYAATITTALGLKAPLESPTFTGTVDFTGATVTGIPVTSAATPTTEGTVKGRISGGTGTTAYSTGIGFEALKTSVGQMNTAIGYQALPSVTNSGDGNSALGAFALYASTSGQGNTAIGVSSLQANTTGYSNAAVGRYALASSTTAHSNTAVGFNSLYGDTTGTQNSGLGRNAGSNITTGSNNLVLGYDSQASSATVSNEITLGNSSITKLRIPGLNLDTSTATNGQVLGWDGSTSKFQWVTPAEGADVNMTIMGAY